MLIIMIIIIMIIIISYLMIMIMIMALFLVDYDHFHSYYYRDDSLSFLFCEVQHACIHTCRRMGWLMWGGHASR
jgi:hypothetical protein